MLYFARVKSNDFRKSSSSFSTIMKVFIDKRVHHCIDEFYDYALLNHEALDEVTIIKKVQRLYDALEALGVYARIYPLARLKKEWTENEYREFICENS